MQVYFDFLPTAQHSNGGEEASRRYNSILLPDDLAIPGEKNLVMEARRMEQGLVSSLRMLELHRLKGSYSQPQPGV